MEYLALAATIGDKFDTMFYGFDMWVYSIFGSLQCGFMSFIAKIFTAFGDEMFVIPVAVLALILCCFKKTRKYALILGLSIGIGTLLTNIILKPLVLRIRPYNTLQNVAEYMGWYKAAGMLSESDYSFPSGHTNSAFEIAVAALFIFRKNGMKKVSFVPLIIAFGTMCSRIYLMVHYPTDVIGGCIAGIISGIAGYFLALFFMYLLENVKFFSMLNDAIDAEKLFKKKPSKQTVKKGISILIVGFFFLSYIPALFEGGEKAIRCDYCNGNFKCYNEAKVDDEDYPAIDGKNYCKIHWKELNGEN